MPSSITHELIAESASRLLPQALRAPIERAPDYYYLGAQGPDLFFFYRPLHRPNLGRTLHRKGQYEWFSALAAALPEQTSSAYEKCLSYAMGFCTHLEADVAFHPFLYAFLEKHALPKGEHQRIENDWDVYFLSELRERSVYRYPFPFDLKRIKREGILFPYIKETAARSGLGNITPSAFARGLMLYRRYLLHFHKRHFRFLRPFLPRLYPSETPREGILSGEEFARLSARGSSADELFLHAAQESASRMQEFCSALPSSPLPRAFSKHMLTGADV